MRKLTLFFLSCLLTITLVGCQTKDAKQEQADFDKFINESLVKDMEDDYLTTHMSFEDPKKYGIDVSQCEVSLGERLDQDDYEESLKEFKESEKGLEGFERDLLTNEQKETYDIFLSQIEKSERSLKKEFQYIGSQFEDGNGLHIQLTSVFEHFYLRKETDIQNLITLLKDTKSYVESAINYTKKQVEYGTFMTNIDSVVEYCQKIVDKGMNSSLLRLMKNNIDSVKINSAKKKEYKQQLDEAFRDYFLTAYENIIDSLKAMKSAKNNTQGLSHIENGKAYYETLVQNQVGEDMSIKEIKKLLEDTADRYYRQLMSVLIRDSSINDKVDNAKTKYSDYQSMLNDLNKKIQNDFPKIENLDYTIKDIDPEFVSGSIGAYFIVPAIDQSTPMQIRVNSSSKDMRVNDVSVFATVAHEGIPGHMYQISYVQQQFANNPYRFFESSNKAYIEGYAKYVEMLSYNYIDDVDDSILQLITANEIYSYLQIVLADIGIHYEGWTVQQFRDYLNDKGLSLEQEQAQEQYDQLQANPAMFIPYFVGFAKFDSLRQKAVSQLGEQFNELGFHEAILKSGEVPFSIVEKNVDDYIEGAKKG